MNRIKRQLTEQSEKVANINRNKRKLKRKEDAQLSEINTNFNGLVEAFQNMLFTTDWDNPKTPEIDVYKEFNAAWVNFCQTHNRSKNNIIKANERAFHEWALDNTKNNKDDKPTDIGNYKLTYLRWSF